MSFQLPFWLQMHFLIFEVDFFCLFVDTILDSDLFIINLLFSLADLFFVLFFFTFDFLISLLIPQLKQTPGRKFAKASVNM